MEVVPINYLAIFGATVASIVIGFLWYGPLLGKKWAALSGIDSTKMKPSAKGLIGMVLTSFIMSYVLAHSLVFAGAYMQVTGVAAGLQVGFWNWLGFVAPVSVGIVLWENKPWTLWFINSGYFLTTLLTMGVILALYA